MQNELSLQQAARYHVGSRYSPMKLNATKFEFIPCCKQRGNWGPARRVGSELSPSGRVRRIRTSKGARESAQNYGSNFWDTTLVETMQTLDEREETNDSVEI
jgi:hypothetical protein